MLRQLARVTAGFCFFVGAIVWPAAVGVLWISESHLVFRADWSRQRVEPFDNQIFHTVQFATADGLMLEGAVLRPEADASKYWILFCPPAGASIHWSRIQDQLLQLRSFGYNVFAFDYRGFGRNAGVPSEQGLYADASGAYRYLTSTGGAPASHVILAGRSLGSAVAAELATHLRVAGLLLLSPIDSVPLTGARIYPFAPVYYLASNQFDTNAKAQRLHVPVLVVHATNDRLVPISAVRSMFARIPGRKLMLETTGGHNRAGFAPGTDLKEMMSELWMAERDE